jgi:hypothetical protein
MPTPADELDRDRKERIRVADAARLDRAAAREVNAEHRLTNAQPFGSRITTGLAPEPFDAIDVA